uniref:DNA helicase n=1 Tax=Saccoglossus kowalevskii TaxID=10224 RepID=A0ABM0N160_SACKO|nr:PREDICTED: SWI/SNF-related matrix-associated actin-dependent regulator of chromatin subfamily A containing DEAD/H box 1-like [Saccoglossus kowalevskii]
MSSHSENESSEEDNCGKAHSRPCSSTSGYCSNNDDDRKERLKSLQNLFVSRSKEELEEFVNSTNTLDEAVNAVLNSKSSKGRKKRSRQESVEHSQDTQRTYSNESIIAPKKRARKEPLALEDSFTDSDATLIGSQNKDKLIEQLKDMFPNEGTQDLERILENSDWSVDAAATIVLSLKDEDDSVETKPQEEKKIEVKKAKEREESPKNNQKMSKSTKSKTDKKSAKQEGYRRIVVVISSDEENEENQNGKDEDSDSDADDKKKQGTCKDTTDGAHHSSNINGAAGTESEDSEDGGDDEEEGYDSEDSYVEEGFCLESKEVIVTFFNESTLEELQMVPFCSKKKAEKIIEMRPFDGWNELCQSMEETKGLTIDLVYDSKTILDEREVVKRLMNKCRKIATGLQKIIARNSDDGSGPVEPADDQIVEQPKILDANYSLKPYQIVGLNWLVLLHRQEVNGILADEMGLGKTVQAIAFLAHLFEEGDKGPFLIIVPSSTIENWVRELNKWCPSLEVLQYYGSQDERKAFRYHILSGRLNFQVMISTYNMCMNMTEDKNLFKKLDFHYMIIDEAHMLKNMNSLRYKNMMKIRAKRRLLLTGTPLQNNLLELMSLLCFIMPHIFMRGGSTDHLKRMFAAKYSSDSAEQSNFEKDRIGDAKKIMQPFVLRRIKTEVLNQLPKKHDCIHRCSLSDSQRKQYTNLVAVLTKSLRSKTESGNLAGAMMQLRKMANHSLLHRHHFNDGKLRKMSKLMLKEPTHHDASDELIFEDMCVMSDFELHGLCNQYYSISSFTLPTETLLNSGKFYKLDSLLPEMKQRGDRVLLFSQFTMMLDIIEVYMQYHKHKYLRLDGQTPVQERLQLIDKYNNDNGIFVFLLSTKAGGLGINLTSANVVIIHDIDFNPYNDKQAEDRCHRVGQTRDVTVIRLICENTIEEAMLKCAMGKLKLEADITADDGDDENATDMASLLRDSLEL